MGGGSTIHPGRYINTALTCIRTKLSPSTSQGPMPSASAEADRQIKEVRGCETSMHISGCQQTFPAHFRGAAGQHHLVVAVFSASNTDIVLLYFLFIPEINRRHGRILSTQRILVRSARISGGVSHLNCTSIHTIYSMSLSIRVLLINYYVFHTSKQILKTLP